DIPGEDLFDAAAAHINHAIGDAVARSGGSGFAMPVDEARIEGMLLDDEPRRSGREPRERLKHPVERGREARVGRVKPDLAVRFELKRKQETRIRGFPAPHCKQRLPVASLPERRTREPSDPAGVFAERAPGKMRAIAWEIPAAEQRHDLIGDVADSAAPEAA